jgi:hypothetical protein
VEGPSFASAPAARSFQRRTLAREAAGDAERFRRFLERGAEAYAGATESTAASS